VLRDERATLTDLHWYPLLVPLRYTVWPVPLSATSDAETKYYSQLQLHSLRPLLLLLMGLSLSLSLRLSLLHDLLLRLRQHLLLSGIRS